MLGNFEQFCAKLMRFSNFLLTKNFPTDLDMIVKNRFFFIEIIDVCDYDSVIMIVINELMLCLMKK